jgi:hypothetical protein
MSFFYVGNKLTSFQLFPINVFWKKVFSLTIYKIDWFLCNCYSSSKVFLLKPKPKIKLVEYIFWIPKHSY